MSPSRVDREYNNVSLVGFYRYHFEAYMQRYLPYQRHAGPDIPTRTKIDVHHHIFPPALSSHKASPSTEAHLGWKPPKGNLPWSPQKSLDAMDAMGVELAVLSYPAGVPGWVKGPLWTAEKIHPAARVADRENAGGREDAVVDVERERESLREKAREMNFYAKEVVENDAERGRREGRQGRFGWFACLPDLRDTHGEIKNMEPETDEMCFVIQRID